MLVLATQGCQSTPRDWSTANQRELCSAFAFHNQGYGRTPEGSLSAVETEIRSRGLIRENQWLWVKARSLRLGMNHCEMMAVRGDPARSNRTVSSDGVRIQWVFQQYSITQGRYVTSGYVYTHNGLVTSWQGRRVWQ